MKRNAITISLCLGLGAIAALSLLLLLGSGFPVVKAQGPDSIDTYYVAPGGDCGTGISPCYSTVQAAVDAADDPDDEIKVAAGTYAGVQGHPAPPGYYGPSTVKQVVYLAKTVTIRGGYTTTNWTTPDPEANPTILDALGQGRVFFIPGDIRPIVDGLRLTNGNAAGLGGDRSGPGTEDQDAGGGVYIRGSAATIAGNQVFSNTAWHGGGLYVNGDWTDRKATIQGNTVFSNTVDRDGGGLWAGYGDATISDNTIRDNVAGYQGGGLYLIPVGHAVTVSGNTIISNTSQHYGGGIYLWLYGSDVTVSDNTVLSNIADDGGGLYLWGNDAALTNNLVADNQAGRGSGLYLSGSFPILLHSTVARNTGGSGIYVSGGTAVFTNTILVSHTVGIDVSSGEARMEATLWGSGPWANGIDWSGNVVTGTVNLWDDPAFVDPDGGDYHIGGTSHARDAGVDAGVTADIDGQLRPMDSGYDIGADEYPGVGLDVVKRPSEIFVQPGQLFTYTIVVTSAGITDATGVVLTDTLDGWQRPVGAVSSLGGCSVADEGWGGTVTCTLGTVATGTTVVVTFTAQVSAAVPMGQAMVNAVVVIANETANSAHATTYAQDCHVRINDDPTTYTTVQAAVDAASPGDVVKAAGYCVGVNGRAGLRQQVYLDKSLTVRGGYTTTDWTTSDPEANPTTLDALGEGRVIYITGDITPTVEGLRITGGDSSGLGGSPWLSEHPGGGVYVVDATATIRDNQIFGNSFGGVFLIHVSGTLSANSIFSNFGRGVYLHTSAATLDGNTVMSNTTYEFGGGVLLFSSDATLVGNTVSGNTAEGTGGGIHIFQGVHTLSGNTICDNVANGTDSMTEEAGGGGLFLDEVSSATLDGNSVYSNTASSRGGGLYMRVSTATLSSNVITGNVAQVSGGGLELGYSQVTMDGNTVSGNTTSGDGGGLLLKYSSNATLDRNTVISNTAERGGGLYLFHGDATFTNNVLADNQANTTGSGLYVDTSQLDMMHTTIARNTGGDGSGVYVIGFMGSSTVALTNTVLVSHTVGIDVSSGSTAEMEATLWGSGDWANGIDWSGNVVTGTVNLWGDPAFLDPDSGDYHIGASSAAVDVGVDAGVTSDMDGQTRPGYGGYDLGADELWLVAAAKTATPGVADPGEMVTYTLVLTNVAGTPLMTSFTDALPAQVDYLGPLTYTHGDGGYASGVVTWTGTVYTNTPARITWAVQVASDTPYSTTIPNVAVISDVAGTFQTDPALVLVPLRRVYLPLVLRQYP